MTLETFEKICKWLPKDADVFFAGYGEPLLHKDHVIFVNRLLHRNIPSSIVTNGKLLSYDKILDLYENGLYKLQISVILKDEENEISKFVNMIAPQFYRKTQFNLLYDETVKKNEPLEKALREMGFKVTFKQIHNRGGELYKSSKEYLRDSPCGTFLCVTYIDTEGSLQICSNDINGKYNLGSIETITFEKLMEMKRQLSLKGDIAPICKLCDDEYRLIHLQKQEVKI